MEGRPPGTTATIRVPVDHPTIDHRERLNNRPAGTAGSGRNFIPNVNR
jgi:hypothetical protein